MKTLFLLTLLTNLAAFAGSEEPGPAWNYKADCKNSRNDIQLHINSSWYYSEEELEKSLNSITTSEMVEASYITIQMKDLSEDFDYNGQYFNTNIDFIPSIIGGGRIIFGKDIFKYFRYHFISNNKYFRLYDNDPKDHEKSGLVLIMTDLESNKVFADQLTCQFSIN